MSLVTLCVWTVVLTRVLAVVLRVEAVLLSMTRVGPCIKVCVTLSCRCRLFERLVLFLVRMVLQVLGCCMTLLRSLVLSVVWTMLVLGTAVPYTATPLWKAFVKMNGLRLISVTLSYSKFLGYLLCG